MKILVCISKVPDTTSKISFTDNNTVFNEAGITFILNPYDEWFALVRALEIKESLGGSVTVINVGPASNDQIIRKALAIGADSAVRVDTDAKDSHYTATQIAAHAKAENYDMILLGKETIDYNSSILGGMLAEMLDLPYISLASNMEMDQSTATLKRDIEGGKETVRVNTPFVASAQKGMAEARIPNMRGIMAARKKPLTVLPATECAVKTTVKAFTLPDAKSAVHLIDIENEDELVRLLHEEAKVI